MRKINEIIIHCSDTQEGCDVTAADIRRWHTTPKEKGGKFGFRDIGYHDVIRLDGTVEHGRPYYVVGAHCEGHNTHSIGICYIGGRKIVEGTGKWVWADTRTEAQTAALRRKLAAILVCFNLQPSCIHGHNEFSNKACPCFDVRQWVRDDFEPWFKEQKKKLEDVLRAGGREGKDT